MDSILIFINGEYSGIHGTFAMVGMIARTIAETDSEKRIALVDEDTAEILKVL